MTNRREPSGGMDATRSTSLKIDVFTDYFPPHLGGGVERVVDEICRRLARQGHVLRVFTFNTDRAPAREVVDGVRVYRAPAIQLTRFTRMQASLSPGLLPLAWRLARSEPPDILHAHNLFFFSTPAAVLLRHLVRRPLVTTLHLGSVRRLGGSSGLLASSYERLLGRAVVRGSDRLVAVSSAVARHAIHLGARPERVRVIANGVDTSRFHPDAGRRNGAFRIACVGRLIFNKGPQYLVEAAPEVLLARPEAEFVFVGDGPLRPHLEKRARQLGVSHRLTFLGTRPDVASILQTCDILVRPSLLEGMPLTVLEAMACGLPVVATPVSGTAELVRHGENGLLVPSADPASLARAILRLMADESLREAQGREGRRLVERGYGWDAVAAKTLAVYRELLPAAHEETAAEPLARAA
jgi:glycosyltransferase involved in cell wall biosynthesis